MSFGGGGSGGISAHVHNNVPLQGGPLDFANDTIASLNAGSTTFSDGAALQELVIGNAGDSMVVNGAGTAPEWGGGAAGAWSPEGNDVSTTATAYLEVSGLSDADVYQVIYAVGQVGDSVRSMTAEVNGVVTDTYSSLRWNVAYDDSGTPYQTDIPKFTFSDAGTGASHTGTFYLCKADTNIDSQWRAGLSLIGQNIMFDEREDPPNVNPYKMTHESGNNRSITGAVTSIRLVMRKEDTDDTSDIIGSMRVNSLSYS